MLCTRGAKSSQPASGIRRWEQRPGAPGPSPLGTGESPTLSHHCRKYPAISAHLKSKELPRYASQREAMKNSPEPGPPRIRGPRQAIFACWGEGTGHRPWGGRAEALGTRAGRNLSSRRAGSNHRNGPYPTPLPLWRLFFRLTYFQ